MGKKCWKFEVSSTHLAFLRNLLSPTRGGTPRRRDVSETGDYFQMESVTEPEARPDKIWSSIEAGIWNQRCKRAKCTFIFWSAAPPHFALLHLRILPCCTSAFCPVVSPHYALLHLHILTPIMLALLHFAVWGSVLENFTIEGLTRGRALSFEVRCMCIKMGWTRSHYLNKNFSPPLVGVLPKALTKG